MPTIYLGADHRGFEDKEGLKSLLTRIFKNDISVDNDDKNISDENVKIVDKGAKTHDIADDFNDPAIAVADAVANHPTSFGILICGSAHGVCMQANRFYRIRAINAADPESAAVGRAHNDANILCLSADRLEPLEMLEIVKVFLTTPFEESERFLRRNARLDLETADIKRMQSDVIIRPDAEELDEARNTNA